MTKILIKSAFNPSRGGHAPGDLRDAFAAALDTLPRWRTSDALPTIEVRGQHVKINAVFKLLWNCSDILPGDLATQLDDVLTSFRVNGVSRYTYAAASRQILVVCSMQAEAS